MAWGAANDKRSQGWFTASKPFITPDQFAVYSRTTPRGLLDFTAATVPEALIVTAENRTTESTRQQRLALIMSITDSNNLKALKREAFKSELAQGLFDALDRAVRSQAPLLWAKLERLCKQPTPFEHYFDGGEALSSEPHCTGRHVTLSLLALNRRSLLRSFINPSFLQSFAGISTATLGSRQHGGGCA